MTQSYIRPESVSTILSFADDNEVLIGVSFVVDGDKTDYIHTENEVQYLIDLLQEAFTRAAIIREMTTMFPEHRESILETLSFRWAGLPGIEMED